MGPNQIVEAEQHSNWLRVVAPLALTIALGAVGCSSGEPAPTDAQRLPVTTSTHIGTLPYYGPGSTLHGEASTVPTTEAPKPTTTTTATTRASSTTSTSTTLAPPHLYPELQATGADTYIFNFLDQPDQQRLSNKNSTPDGKPVDRLLPGVTVNVICQVYFPDGKNGSLKTGSKKDFWYMIAQEPWMGRFVDTTTFENKGGSNVKDMQVPSCTSLANKYSN
jgi:hypothetical protein